MILGYQKTDMDQYKRDLEQYDKDGSPENWISLQKHFWREIPFRIQHLENALPDNEYFWNNQHKMNFDKLGDKARLDAMAKTMNIHLVHAADLDEVATHLEPLDKIVVDMDHYQSELVVEKYPKQCYVFGPHIQADKMKKFRSFGCKHVHPRSVFFEDFEEIIEKG